MLPQLGVSERCCRRNNARCSPDVRGPFANISGIQMRVRVCAQESTFLCRFLNSMLEVGVAPYRRFGTFHEVAIRVFQGHFVSRQGASPFGIIMADERSEVHNRCSNQSDSRTLDQPHLFALRSSCPSLYVPFQLLFLASSVPRDMVRP